MPPQKRARSSSLSSLSSAEPVRTVRRKKPKVETRECPVCNELIPLRLLERHASLEAQRVEERVISQIGELEILEDDLEEGSSTGVRRRSALRAQQSWAPAVDKVIAKTNKTLQSIKSNRKKRYVKLRDMTKEIEEGYLTPVRRGSARHEVTCPVCLDVIAGDEDVVDAHIDACLAHEAQRVEEERRRAEAQAQRASEEQYASDPEETIIGNIRGTGFQTRDRHEQDIEEDIDIDGDDEGTFGSVQFTEGDVLIATAPPPEDVEVDIEGDEEEEKTLHELIAEGRQPSIQAVKAKMDEIMGVGNMDKLDTALQDATRSGSKSAMIKALGEKIKYLEASRIESSTSLICRICLDPYDEPTVSTGCWHTCCRECWLRCLGSTKLCPICKRITGATDLRRVYL
ncbi:hypothetical protein CYLTODRAFT_485111 [Cylindrobasidium torrendii FP15055 ss-10]|uniref:RING-type domain-containing protein n=1 Tax=Cylindrobasidium torrendii FP15055 ss-10 TaxID=1314674 RepID=A0A0D7BWG6_9AGAR|nr:hypothetical protein CYLTODRAFT_485111 [Cylindrobasidium torrendii FP15055 ss-10]